VSSDRKEASRDYQAGLRPRRRDGNRRETGRFLRFEEGKRATESRTQTKIAGRPFRYLYFSASPVSDSAMADGPTAAGSRPSATSRQARFSYCQCTPWHPTVCTAAAFRILTLCHRQDNLARSWRAARSSRGKTTAGSVQFRLCPPGIRAASSSVSSSPPLSLPSSCHTSKTRKRSQSACSNRRLLHPPFLRWPRRASKTHPGLVCPSFDSRPRIAFTMSERWLSVQYRAAL
jgi:hypothetical protein